MPGTTAPAVSVTRTEVSSPDDVDTATSASGNTPAVPLGGDTVTADASWTSAACRARAASAATRALAAATSSGLGA